MVSRNGNDAIVTNPAAVTKIKIQAGAGTADLSVAFADSGANAYTASFDVNLDEAGSTATFTGRTTINPPSGTVLVAAGDIQFTSGDSSLVVGGTGTALTLTDRSTDLTLPATLRTSGP